MIRAIITLGIATILLLGCCGQKSMIKQARKENTVSGYENYLSKYKDGKYVAEARQSIADIRFSALRDSVFNSFVGLLNSPAVNNTDMIEITPANTVLMGTPVQIKLRHLPPNQRITLHSVRARWNGRIYAFAVYESDENGEVLLNRDTPLMGTYTGVDSLGIFWSMTWPPQGHIDFPDEIKRLQEHTILLYIESNHRIIAHNELELLEKSPNIVSIKIHSDSMAAMFHYPKDATGLPGLVFLSGGEGGYENISRMARIIASHGYAVLALAYYHIDPLPKHLERIPLEYIFHAIDWIKTQPNIDSSKVLVVGGSRGGELALQVASLRPDVHGVIAVEPSCVRWQGLPHSPGSVFFPKPAWTLNGKTLPYLRHNMDLGTMMKFGNGSTGIDLMKLYEGKLDERDKVQKALIHVEDINGPILLAAGMSSRVWPAYRMCQIMEARLDSLGFEYPVVAQYYPDTGHYVTITPDLDPTISYRHEQVLVGGTDAGNAASQLLSWNNMLEFLDKYFENENNSSGLAGELD